MSVPRGWTVKPLDQLAETALGKMLDRGKSRGLAQVPYLRNVNVQWDRIDTGDLLTMELADNERERFRVRAGDLLVCEGGEVGRAAIWNGREEYLAYQKALHRVRSRGDLDLKFLRYLLEHYRHDGTLARHSTGSTIAHLPQQKLKALPVPHPPLIEQKRIVEVLEGHLSRLDVARSSIEISQLRLECLGNAVCEAAASGALLSLQGAVSLETHEVKNPNSGKLPIGWRIAKQWRWESLDRLAELVVDGDHNPPKRVASGVPHVTAKSVRAGKIELYNCSYITEEGYLQTSARYNPRPGDVIVTCVGTIGRVAIVPPNIRFSADRNIAAVRVKGSVLRQDFLELVLNSTTHQQLMKAASSSTAQPHLYLRDLRALPIPVPPLVEQEQLAQAAQAQLEDAERLRSSLTSAESRAKALRQALLNAAFTGGLTGRTTDVEIIEELTRV